MTILVTGGAGFIGSNFILNWFEHSNEVIVNIDKLTYAGNLQTLLSLERHPQYHFVQADIKDSKLISRLLSQYRPRAVINFAAETHVDRSIHGPEDFIQTNIVGTFSLLECARNYWDELPVTDKKAFRFLQISTDEVYGSLLPEEPPFDESSRYTPNSPYAASKAASDHLLRAWHYTYGLPVLTTNCSNNYGPRQFPEKLIPLMILNALEGKPLPVYGDGLQIRDWLYVQDHCEALCKVLSAGQPGQNYNIGGGNEKTNLSVVQEVCAILDQIRPRSNGKSYHEQISFVTDRPGHDRRYAIDIGKMSGELDWQPRETFATGLRKTIQWYLDNNAWVQSVQNGSYRAWISTHYKDESLKGNQE
ncbi:MAG: dTDP-glucose 4,6-dehydratase [Alcaligenaceae bacterium]|nr:dTDP-glucose 4,6-dehydratase [Alcaligenaceae bacterium]